MHKEEEGWADSSHIWNGRSSSPKKVSKEKMFNFHLRIINVDVLKCHFPGSCKIQTGLSHGPQLCLDRVSVSIIAATSWPPYI